MQARFSDIVFSEKGLKSKPTSEENYISIQGDSNFCNLSVNDKIWLLNLETKELVRGEITKLLSDGEIFLDNEFLDIEEYDILMKI